MIFFRPLTLLVFATGIHAGATPLLEETFDRQTGSQTPGPPWSASQSVDGSSIVVDAAAQSSIERGAHGLVWNDEDSTSWGPTLTRPFTPQTGDTVLVWSFDYLAPDDGRAANANINLAATKGTASAAGPNLFLDRIPGELQANDGLAVVKVASVAPDTWHRIEVTAHLKTKTYDVVVKGPGGATMRKSGLKFRNPATDTLSFLNLGDGSQTTAGGSIHLDNIRLAVRAP